MSENKELSCDEARELITGRVDEELAAPERTALEGHLKDCPDCRGQLERETALKSLLKRASAAVAAPAALRAKIKREIRSEGAAEAAPKRAAARMGFSLPRPVWAFAVVIAVIAAAIYQFWPREDIGATAIATHQSVVTGKRALVRTGDPTELRRRLAVAVDNRFSPVALDLSVAKLYPVAGFVMKIAGRDVLVTVYEGDGPTVTCYTFLGSEADAPKGAVLSRDEESRADFFLFSQGDMSAVMHRTGEVICILIAKLPGAELLDLIQGKAHHT